MEDLQVALAGSTHAWQGLVVAATFLWKGSVCRSPYTHGMPLHWVQNSTWRPGTFASLSMHKGRMWLLHILVQFHCLRGGRSAWEAAGFCPTHPPHLVAFPYLSDTPKEDLLGRMQCLGFKTADDGETPRAADGLGGAGVSLQSSWVAPILRISGLEPILPRGLPESEDLVEFEFSGYPFGLRVCLYQTLLRCLPSVSCSGVGGRVHHTTKITGHTHTDLLVAGGGSH
jgi:hypothetical protein